ncbi:5-oxoprolinase subunit PxpB [Heyndrickxia sporothermodurans]|uniref:5-oxoprolinase subunit PxpB n=1 Tax=Heyndrickxia sporothermodurans TaxID=46224 RepID=A0AB37HD27_9BACI|nr:5-oxoprolinase subunit PxpB [Heyndrickxia sporothermodurans]MBL5782115.1 5-oxoprolinase subunit PxpB [Heyndrickxia sporothermodurans]MBL5796425.1 5-oxoprolinase subunit PxpB [Heyndrickxia sporothermodurans]MBL5803857.1 5-oxoprolinase subunit PxpB [Heyndrickxia sporothermodurans]MBL5807438.1 5-oxoprolinase subunit PxpB [Heyndrickxia sporothermodurans]MBL5832031.1 5-oxoprolinase subunit PxpB [Heyndrickxia sporothermodurans]
MEFRYKAAGDSAILMELDAGIDEKTNKRIIHLSKLIEDKTEEGFGEVIIGYRSILVQYNPLRLSYQQAVELLKYLETNNDSNKYEKRRHIEIPVLYGGEHGPDLESVATYNKLSPKEVISIHSDASYLVYFMGFTPGFPFMGGMSKRIATPRLENPRISIPSGSVGIANNQTGIYPVESPGGWRLIGQTPMRLYDWQANQPFLLHAGDKVTFKEIQIDEFNEIKEQVEDGKYIPVIKN